MESLLRDGAAPLVIAHRGASAHAPENTMPAFTTAWAAGCSWVETDVQPTVDGVPVLLHDDTLERTSTGRGPVREARARDVATLDAGSWFDPAFAGTRIPELGELLGAVTTERSVLLEIKGEHSRDQIAAVLQAVRGARLDDRVLLQSFEVPALRLIGEIEPGRPFGLLVEELDPDPVAAARTLGAAVYNPSVDAVLARPAVVGDLHAAGLAVLVWTCDDPGGWAELTALGVDGIITNTPAELLAWQRSVGPPGQAGSNRATHST